MTNEPRVTVLDRWTAWLAPATDAEWDEAYAWHLPRVYNFFRYRVGDGPEAEDLTSITFEKAWRARDRYRRDLAGFGTWLLTIARRVAIDHLRTRKRHEPLDRALEIPAAGTPEQDAARRSDAARLGRLIEALDERERELLALKYGAELPHREIARLTGLSESNVGTLLHRVVERLRSRWGEGDA